ncbi:MAG: hypothetical protein IMZ61_00035 [Planctomycetes bacterium]|nr:hypothetical protein [Planctomycetota bacterium]
MHKKNWRLFYPILMGIYPAVGLISVNISQMVLSAGMRSVLVTVLFSLAAYGLFCWRIKDEYKAALLCAWFMLFFFAYGHVYGSVEGIKVFGVVMGRNRFLFPLWLVIFGVGAWWIYKRARRLESFSRVLNMVSIILLVIPVIQIGVFEWQRNNLASDDNAPVLSGQAVSTSSTHQLPDVYYIILDSYGRQDMLSEYYQLDISEFVEQLEAIGFYVVPCSQSNYGITDFSLASSLNMNYIEEIAPPAVENQSKWAPLGEPIRHSLVRQIFEEMDYKIVAFESGVWWSQMQDADYYLHGTSHGLGIPTNFWLPNGFEILFLRTTALRTFLEVSNAWLGTFFVDSLRGHAQYIEYTLGELENVPRIPGSKFVFVHLMAPHAPYVFNPEGDFIFTEAANPGYPNEIEYLNKRLVPLVKTIIEESSVPPIIIIQGDHGLDTEVRLAIFNAIYFPKGGDDVLYPTMTPVNTFRLVLNAYFDQNFPLLPDISYYSAYGDYYDFTEVMYPCAP